MKIMKKISIWRIVYLPNDIVVCGVLIKPASQKRANTISSSVIFQIGLYKLIVIIGKYVMYLLNYFIICLLIDQLTICLQDSII